MKCRICKIEKLSKEFPPANLTEKCEHYISHCLRCIVDYVKKEHKCPDCNLEVDPNSITMQVYETILEQLFGIEPEEYTELVIPESEKNGILNVKTLTGEFVHVGYDPEMTVVDLKTKVKDGLKLNTDKIENLKLIYKNRELKMYKKSYELVKIKDYDIPKNSSLQLIILLYTVSSGLKHLVFDLSWQFPKKIPDIFRWIPLINYFERDHVDATCFVFEGEICMQVVNAETKKSDDGAVVHSGSKLNQSKRTGKQSIKVDMTKLKPQVKHLFFTLSARDTPTLSDYPNPKLKLYDESDTSKSLCKSSFRNELAQSIVMCSLSLDTDGLWRVYDYGEKTEGNIKNYNSLKLKLGKLVKTFFSRFE